MNIRSASGLCLVPFLAAASLAATPMAAPPVAGQLQPHRAVYAIGLASTTHGSGVTSANGQMVFELTGSRCAGYTMRQRLVVNLGDEDGKGGLLDFRITTFESGTGDVFRFNSRTTVDEQLVENLEGVARRTGSDVEVSISSPKAATVRLAADTLFPSQHLQVILDAARAEKHFVAAEIYEGAGTGQASDDAAAAIGAAGLGSGSPEATKGVRNWPVSVGYFSDTKPAALPGLGEETPAYQMSFTLFENGVTNNLVMDYGKYALSGTLQKLEPLSEDACR